MCLDDMMATVDQDNQQQALDAMRQHINSQLQAVDDRLGTCERHVNNVLAAQHGGTKHSPQMDHLTVGLEAVRARSEQQAAEAQRWHDDITQQLQHISLTMIATGDKREHATANKPTTTSTAAPDKHELLAVKADVTAVAARMSSVEDELSKKVDYSEETNAVLQQQLTAVEVKVSRMEAEWAVIREERERQRSMSVSSNPPSTRQAAVSLPSSNAGEQSWTSVVSQQLSELRAQVNLLSSRLGPLSPKMGPVSPKMAPLNSSRLATQPPDSARRTDLSAVQGELQRLQQALTQQVGELASQINTQQQQLEAWKANVLAELQQQTKLPQPSKLPRPSSATNGIATTRPASATAINAKLGVLNTQLTDLTQQFMAQQDEQKTTKQRTEDKLRQMATDQQQLVHAVQQLKDRVRQMTSQSQRGAGTARLSDSEGVLLASLSSHSSPTAAGGHQTELRLQQLEQTLTSQVGELSSRLTQLTRQVHDQPAVSDAAAAVEVAALSARSSSMQSEPAAAVSAELSQLQQAMVAQVGELSWRINDLASKQAELAQQLTALATTAASTSFPSLDPSNANASTRASVDSAPAAASQPVDSSSVSPRTTEMWNGLSSEVEDLKQQLHAQVAEMSWKMAQLQSQLESLAAASAAGQLSQEQNLTSRQTTNTTEASNSSPLQSSEAPAAAAVDAAFDSQLEHLRQSMTAQLGELSFRLNNEQQALRNQLSNELIAVNSSYQRLHQQLEQIKDTLAAAPPVPAATPPTLAAQSSLTSRVKPAIDAAAIAQVESKVEQLQQSLTVQVAELSHRLNDLTVILQQPTQPQLTESSVSLAVPPPTQQQPVDIGVLPQSSVDDSIAQATTSRRSSQGLASPTPLQAAIEAAQSQWQQQFKALADDTRTKLDSFQHATQQPTNPAQPHPSTVTSLESELVATSNRLSSLVAKVQRMEESATQLRSTEAAEMEDIVNRITAIYKKSKDDIASLQAAVTDIRHGMEAKEVQLKRLDEHVVDDIRRLMDDMVRVDGEGKGERLLMQRKLREIEHALSLINSKLNGRSAQPADELRDVKSARTHVDSPRPVGGGDGDAAGASKLSFLSPAHGGRVKQHGRSVSSIESSKEPVVDVAGRPDSQQMTTPRHHPHISIELTTPLAQQTHPIDNQSTDDAMYDQQTTPKPSDDNHYGQPRENTTPSPQPPAQPQRVAAAFHDRGLSIEVNASPLSYIQQQVQPLSPAGPLLSTRSLHQSPQHSSPQHRIAAMEQQSSHPQHRQQMSEPNLQPQLNQSPTLAGKGKPSSRAQPATVQTDRPIAREQQRRTSASKRLIDMATSPAGKVGEQRPLEMKPSAHPLASGSDMGGLSVLGSSVSGATSSVQPTMDSSVGTPKRPSLSASAAVAKHARTQSAANKSAGTYETKLQ